MIDVANTGYRRNGGIGFSIDSLSQTLKVSASSTISLDALASVGYSIGEIDTLSSRLKSIQATYGLTTSISIDQVHGVRRHAGLGAGTALNLACVEALAWLNDISFEQPLLQRLSGRGGTSGVGIQTYFSGGMVLDIGRRFDEEPICSSDDNPCPRELPVMLQNVSMPNWRCGVLVSKDLNGLTLEQERAFFASSKVSESSVQAAAYHAIFGILGGVISLDYGAFCKAVNAVQANEWKSKEIALYGKVVKEKMSALRDIGCDAVGMSSLGPTIFFFCKEMDVVEGRIRQLFNDDSVEIGSARNQGRELIFD